MYIKQFYIEYDSVGSRRHVSDSWHMWHIFNKLHYSKHDGVYV